MLALLAPILLPRPDAAAAATGPAKPRLNVVVIGDFFSYGYADSADPALQRSAPPTLQALNQIQAANPGVQVSVLFIPVTLDGLCLRRPSVRVRGLEGVTQRRRFLVPMAGSG